MRDHVHVGQFAGVGAWHVVQLLVEAIAVREFVSLVYCSGADVHELAATSRQVDHATVAHDERGFHSAGFLVVEGKHVGAAQSVHVGRFQSERAAGHEAGEHALRRAFREFRCLVDRGHAHLVEAVGADVVADDAGDTRPAFPHQHLEVLFRRHFDHLPALRLLCDCSHDYCSFSSMALNANLRYVAALTTYSLRVVGL